jgi:hypothetical protein
VKAPVAEPTDRPIGRRFGVHGIGAIFETVLSLGGSMATTTLLGLAFWDIAAGSFSQVSVGLAAAGISAMTLAGTISVVGLGSVLVRELPHQPGMQYAIVRTSTIVAALIGFALGGAFVIVAPLLDPDFAAFAAGWHAFVFVGGCAATAASIVIDHAVLGLGRPRLHTLRNTAFSVIKLVLLAAGAWWLNVDGTGVVIFGAWAIAVFASQLFLLPMVRGARRRSAQPSAIDWAFLRQLSSSAVAHQILSFAQEAPPLILPVAVIFVTSPVVTANFYLAWLMASFVFAGQLVWITSLFAVGSRTPARVPRQAVFTTTMALATAVVGVIAATIFGRPILEIFGAEYADAAADVLPILTAAAIPLVFKDTYTVVERIRGRPGRAAPIVAVGGVLEVALATGGAALAGLPGLAVGFLVATSAEAIVFVPILVRVLRDEDQWQAISASLGS